MGQKKTFVLRVDPEKFEALEKWAADEFRSVNGQLEWIIDQALRKAGRVGVKTDNGNLNSNNSSNDES
ncbi:MAG TPA: Arc family DNA-binding protein [Tenuifilaceae bacterium]|nr:Arc family DNA-binding protein [Tenuifilaceae bacterium]